MGFADWWVTLRRDPPPQPRPACVKKPGEIGSRMQDCFRGFPSGAVATCEDRCGRNDHGGSHEPVSSPPPLNAALQALAVALTFGFGNVAMAQTVDCGVNDAPASHNTIACNSVCGFLNNIWTCEAGVTACADKSVEAYAVSNYNGVGSDYSAWGTCVATGSKFCCAHTEQGQGVDQVDEVHLKGGAESDALSFHDVSNNMRPARPHDLLGYIFGGENTVDGGDEVITGSDYAGSDYRDHLYGEGGGDYIYGLADADVIFGGEGGDWVEGGGGNDRIDGGAANDHLDGGDNHDTLCDSTLLDSVGGGCTDNTMIGGLGVDVFWYFPQSGCLSAPYNLDPALTDVGPQMNEDCGPVTGAWGPLPWTGCDNNIDVEPATCP